MKSLAFPTDMAISSDGKTLYVAAFGSSKIGVFDTAALENDSFVPIPRTRSRCQAADRAGLALDERAAALRADALRQFHFHRRSGSTAGNRAPGDVQSRTGQRHQRPPLPL